jgi:hypothetical protein
MSVPLERLRYRAPVALDCVDGITGKSVGGRLVAKVWRRDEPTQVFTARRSPVSGLLGIGLLPGLWTSTHRIAPVGDTTDWPAADPVDVCALVSDSDGRYLTASVTSSAPMGAPLVVRLDSHQARPTPSGSATVRGQVTNHDDGAPLAWAVITVTIKTSSYRTVSDQNGCFLLYFPWPEALPPLVGSPPEGVGLAAVTWQATISVLSQPSALTRSPGLTPQDPPEQASIDGQQAAQVDDGNGNFKPSITKTLNYGSPLVIPLSATPS